MQSFNLKQHEKNGEMKKSKLKKVGYSKFCQHARKNSEAMKSHNKK
jgi:hypothetical protein